MRCPKKSKIQDLRRINADEGRRNFNKHCRQKTLKLESQRGRGQIFVRQPCPRVRARLQYNTQYFTQQTCRPCFLFADAVANHPVTAPTCSARCLLCATSFESLQIYFAVTNILGFGEIGTEFDLLHLLVSGCYFTSPARRKTHLEPGPCGFFKIMRWLLKLKHPFIVWPEYFIVLCTQHHLKSGYDEPALTSWDTGKVRSDF